MRYGFTVGFVAAIGKLPIPTRLKVYREFAAVNRMEGMAGYFTVSLPIAIDTNAMALESGKRIKAKF